jgi:hypothetical protein
MLTVSSAASSRALTTLQAVKDDLGLSDGTDDARLIRLIDQASDAIERHCARRLARRRIACASGFASSVRWSRRGRSCRP